MPQAKSLCHHEACATMQTFSCQCGSNGNCIFVQAGGTRLLIDAGISGRRAQQRMTAHGQEIRQVEALLISHDHIDHVRSAGIFNRRFGIPIYATEQTCRASRRWLGEVDDVRVFAAGDTLTIGEAVIRTIPTPHDAVDGVCFVIEHAGRNLGVLTDLGFVFPELEELMGQLDAVYLESNYDPEMLRTGPYPIYLQRRIAGDGGHLANAQAATLLRDCTNGRLRWAALAHLSEHNNTPELAYQTAAQIIGPKMPIHIASRYDVSAVFEI
jgi:phosphoribosyl 1,2-cyclic phosphodiesterase